MLKLGFMKEKSIIIRMKKISKCDKKRIHALQKDLFVVRKEIEKWNENIELLADVYIAKI
jgi:hypothetical protein